MQDILFSILLQIAYTKAVAKLMRYMKGANADKERIELTSPTVAALKLSKDAQVRTRSSLLG